MTLPPDGFKSKRSVRAKKARSGKTVKSAKPAKSPKSIRLIKPEKVKPREACGGVLINEQGHVLLVEPAHHYDNTVWTWPKGQSDGKQNAEAVALREVFEETGYKAEIICPIPGSWPGSTGRTQYFLMRPVGPQGPTDWEIASTRWVPPEIAPSMINATTKEGARERDLEVLAAALQCYKAWKAEGS